MNIFIKAESLSILQAMMRAAVHEQQKKKRAPLFKKCARLLKDLGLVVDKAPIIGFGEGVDSAGDKGWWILLDEQRTVEAFDALSSIPQTAPGKPIRCAHCGRGLGEAHAHTCPDHVCNSYCPEYNSMKGQEIETIVCGAAKGVQCELCTPVCKWKEPHRFVAIIPQGTTCKCGAHLLDFIHEEAHV